MLDLTDDEILEGLRLVGLSLDLITKDQIQGERFVVLRKRGVMPILICVPPDGDVEWSRKLLLNILKSAPEDFIP